jgi:hypothetical protein
VERLQEIKEQESHILPTDLGCYKKFGISKSLRRGATLATRAQGVSEKLIDQIN